MSEASGGMRLLANENISGSVIKELRNRGYDVLSAKESMCGAGHSFILQRARADGRLLLTHDKDFGQLAFHSQLPAGCGIILFRFSSSDPENQTRRILAAVESRRDWAGHFTVVSDITIRQRALPPMRNTE